MKLPALNGVRSLLTGHKSLNGPIIIINFRPKIDLVVLIRQGNSKPGASAPSHKTIQK